MKLEDVITAGIAHSCYPNSGYNTNFELIKLREIFEYEVLSVDYSTLFTGRKYQFACNCGHVGCRGIIVGFDNLPVIIQEKYLKANVVPIRTRLNYVIE